MALSGCGERRGLSGERKGLFPPTLPGDGLAALWRQRAQSREQMVAHELGGRSGHPDGRDLERG